MHVPYKATPQAINDVMTGRVAMMFVDFAVGSPQAKAGKVRALAVTTKERSALLPDIPSMTEAGLPRSTSFPGTPCSRRQRRRSRSSASLNRELRRIVDDPQIRARLAALGFDAFSSTPEELATFVREDLAKWTQWVRTRAFSRNDVHLDPIMPSRFAAILASDGGSARARRR